jgi:hypothetical protein
MINIFEVFLPQLLRYPNPNDPLNGEAAALIMRHPKEYDAKVKGTSANETAFDWMQLTSGIQNTCNDSQPRKRLTQQMRRTTKTKMK